MSSWAAVEAGEGADDRARAADLLRQLESAHEQLAIALEAMKAATQTDDAMSSAYLTARWRLSNASRHRRGLVQAACAHLLRGADADESAAISAFLVGTHRILTRSTAHVAKWSKETIELDWPGYCRASHGLRAEMAEQIEAEKRLLYPLLRSRALGR